MQNDQKNLKGLSFAYRISSELIAAVIVGVLLGLFLDKLLDTKPIFLINTNNFWNPFVSLLDHMEKNKFIRTNGDKNIKFSSLGNLFVVKNLEELSLHKKFNSI